MKTFEKVLYKKDYNSPIFWGSGEEKAQSYFELKMCFDFKNGLRFTASVANMSACRRNPFTAICIILEYESIGMAKYQMLKDRVRKAGVAQQL